MVDGRPREEIICSSTISALTVSTEVGIDGDVATDRTALIKGCEAWN